MSEGEDGGDWFDEAIRDDPDAESDSQPSSGDADPPETTSDDGSAQSGTDDVSEEWDESWSETADTGPGATERDSGTAERPERSDPDADDGLDDPPADGFESLGETGGGDATEGGFEEGDLDVDGAHPDPEEGDLDVDGPHSDPEEGDLDVDGPHSDPEETVDDWTDGVWDEDDDAPPAGGDAKAEPPGGGTDEEGAGGESSAADDNAGALFEDDFAAALSDTDVPDPDGAAGGGGTSGGEFSMTGGSGAGADPTDSAFDMGTDDFGDLGGLGGDDGFDADEEDLDSEIDRINLGVEGLDAMIQGGIPERTLMVAIGSPGTGKTTLGLHFLEEGLENGEKAVYITLEETRERVIRSATEKNMPFDEYHEQGDLAVIDIDPVEMANSLQTIRSELPRLIDEFGASRLVLDSVSLLEMMYEDRATRRNEIYDFTKSLKASGVTTLMTSEASEDSPYTSRHRIVEYLTDAVFILQYVRPSDFRETRLAIEIQKIRDAHHSRETKPYEITNEGMSVYRQANIF